MRNPIDERAAWHLLRAVPRGLAEAGGTARVRSDIDPETHLIVEGSGEWEASQAMTGPARDLLDLFLPLQVRDAWTLAQLGQSLDGRIATEAGHSHYVTGAEDRRRLHRSRALADAVVVGAHTVRLDDPRLTVREVEGENPVRVVIDPEGTLASTHVVFVDGRARTIVVVRASRARARAASGEVDRVHLEADASGGLPPSALVAALKDRGLRRILVEGGGQTVSRFLQEDALDRLHLTVAPLLIGSGRPSIVLEPIESLDHALRPHCRHFHLGEDVLFDLVLSSKPTPRPKAPPDPGE